MMELQRISILFCTLAVSVSRRAPENLSQEALCTSQCTGFSGPNLPAGSRFSYRYSTATHTLLQGRAYTKSGTSLESTAVVEVLAKCHRVLKLRDVQIKTTFESGEKLIKENGRLREALEQYPLLFCVHDGRILKLFPQESEPTWALNIKRGILSVLQTSSTTAGNSSVDEVDVLGKCPTSYQWRRSLLLKRKDLNQCSHHFSGFTALRSVALPGASSQQQLLSSNLECVQRFDEAILAEAKCTEYHLIAPLATKGRGGVKTQTQTAMKLFRVEVDFSFERVDTKNIYESTLLYERENTARWSREEEVAETLQRLCMKPSVNSESTDLFMTLVFELQHLTSDALMSLWRRTSIECKDNWQPLLDALPSCATEACVVLMKEMIVSGEVEEDKIESFFWSLSFIPEPTAGMIDVLASLLQLPSGRQSTFLGISSLVHHFCAVRNDCDQEPAVWGIMKILEGYLGRTCIVHESEENRQVELVLRAIGNAGLAASRLTPVLSSCAQLKSNPVGIRLAAVEAFRRIPCAANRTVLVHLYQTYNEDVEIRIASYLMAMNCPGGELFSQIKWILQEEKSSQVGSFVWSHLSQLLETNDPLKQHLKNALPDEILSKEFDGETWKFSSYSDITFHSAAASANVEGRLIFSPASFIPRTIATNLTIHVLGRAINLLELVVRLENMEDAVQKFFGFHPVQSTKARRSQPEPPLEMTRKTQRHKRASKRHSLGNNLPSKESKPKLRGGRQSCPNGHYSEMSELVKKFTKRMGKKKKPKCVLSIKIFGNELTIVDCGELRSQAKRYYLNLAELVVKVLKGQEVQFNKRLSLGREELLFPAISGLPVLLALNISAAVNVTIKGNMDFKQRNHFFINGYIKPSANLQISAQMGTVGMLGTSGLTWASGIRSSTSLDGGIQVKRGKEFKVFLNTPEDSMEMVYFSSQLYVMTVDGREPVDHFPGHVEMKSCTNEGVSKMFGWQLCSEISYPNEDTTGFFIFPFHGPIKVAMTLAKKDRSLRQYLLKAAYNYISQKGSWIPNEAGFHFFIGTPQSELKRDVAVDLYFNIPQKTFRIEFIQPMKKIQMNGKIEASRNSRVGHLEMILDDKDAYYVKVKTDLQTVSGEQRYTTQLEAKLRKSGSPIILSGNVTKQPGKKMALSISLINLLKDAAFLSVCLEKKTEDKLRQYSLEGETHIPGVLGSHVIGLLQQRGHLWSNALRVKYGLFGDAKNLQHECNMGQMLKVGNSPHDTYRLDLEHELYCTQILAYNHKVSLHHEESAPQLYSKLEVNYGKHWDEINNKRRVLISQTFKNNSYASLASYFMEFTVQVLEKQVDYRTQFQHTHSTMSYVESSTSFKVQYTNYMPFVAELQWKDMSRYHLKKWEGTFNMDTPWLYLYIAHKLQQPQRSAYLSTVEFTTGKALIVKGLVVEIFCKNKDNEKEARIRIHTPTTTYLRAATSNRLERDFLHSQSEVVSIWNQLVKNEIHVENREQAKFLHFKIKSAKHECNMTAAYFHLEAGFRLWESLFPALLETDELFPNCNDHKTLPVVLQLQAQIEEVRKEKMLYQKCGTLHFRHPFKLPIPQSFLLQETFTVNKKEKHYFLETKVLINGLEESVHTLTLGYEAENSHICAGLTHPYNSEIFPQNVEACATTRNLSSAKCEVEATLKINKKDVLSILGKYQNKSSGASSHHLGQVEMTHSFQLMFPQSVTMNGELFSKETKVEDFDWGLMIKATIDRNNSSQFSAHLNGSDTRFGLYSQLSHWNQSYFVPSFQAHATASRYGRNGLSGSFYLRSSGKDLVLLETSVNREVKKAARVLGVSIVLRQTVLTPFKYLGLQLVGKMLPSRLVLSSVVKLNHNSFRLGITGSKEHKVGLLLTLHGSVQHNIDGLKCILPQHFSLNGSLKRKKNIHEGIMKLIIDQSEYGLHLRNRNMFGNASLHNIIVALTQNGSQAFPSEAKLRGQLELHRGIQRGAASMQVDTGALCIDISNVISQEQMGVSGTLTHNISAFHMAGLPTENSITAVYGHLTNNHTVTLKLEGGNQRITAAFGVEKLHLQAPRDHLRASFNHNIAELKNHGIPFTVECVCYYQTFSKKLLMGVRVQADEEEFKVQWENQGTNSTVGFALVLHHNVGFLLHIFPATVEVQCDGESAFNQLSGHCSGEVASHSSETPALILLNGSVLATNCTVNVSGELPEDAFAQVHTHAACIPEHRVEISFRHDWPYLRSQGLAQENRIKVVAVRGDEYRSLLEATFGEHTLTANGELSTAGDRTAAEWRVVLLDKGDILERAKVPLNLISEGSFFLSTYNVSLTAHFRCHGKGADIQLEMSSADQYIMQGTLSHSLSHLGDLGLPSENEILLSVTNGSILEGLLLLHLGNCRLKAHGELQGQNRTEWTWELEAEGKLLQDLGVPQHSQLTGSIWKDGCQAEFRTALQSEGKGAFFEMRTRCQPKVTLEAELRHELPFLRRISKENKLCVNCKTGPYISLDLKSGPCELQASLDFHAENQFQWHVSVKNGCQVVQDHRIPVKIDGSGHIIVAKKNLDSQVLVTAGENTLRGVLVLRHTHIKQELHALLTHNIKGTGRLGIPSRTAVDLIWEKRSAVHRRFFQFRADSKQITEEFSFTQKPERMSLDYKLTHNLETLQELWIEDRVELQAAAVLKDFKNVSVKVQYGSHWLTAGGQIRKTDGRMDIRGNFQHMWLRLLQAHIPGTLQVILSLETNATHGRQRQSVAGQGLLSYTFNALHVAQQSNVCCSLHDMAPATSSAPTAIALSFMFQKLEHKAGVMFQGQCDNKTVAVAMDVFSGFEFYGPFELTAEVKHSLNHLKQLGLPFSLKLTLLEILSENNTEGSLKLACDSNLSLSLVFSAKNELQSEILKIKSVQNLPFLQYLPSIAEASSKIDYSTKEAEGKVFIHMENEEFLVLTKLTFTDTNHTQVVQLMHTMPQLTILPRQLVLTTAFQKSRRTQVLRGTALWDGREVKFTGAYTGLSQKTYRGHDIKVEIHHPLLIPLPWHSTLKVHVEHSTRSHRDEVVVGWDSKEQIIVSSSLKIGKEHANYHAALSQPFNFTVKQIEVSSLTESRRGLYNQQMQLAWNSGEPTQFKCTFRDKSKTNVTFWDACILASSGQLQSILTVGSLQACGTIEQTPALFNQHLDMKWDGKKVKQNLTYEKGKLLPLDKIQWEALAENVFLTSCSSQHILGKVEMDYSTWLNYYTSLRLCDLPNAITLLGKHQLNKGEFLWQSEGKLSLADDEASISVALRNHSNTTVKNYAAEFAFKAPKAVSLDVTGSLMSSAAQSEIVVEGIIDPKEKVKLIASKGKECVQYYMGYLKGDSEDGLELAACTDGQQHAALNAHLVVNGAIQEEVGNLVLEATDQSLSLKAHGCGNPVIKIESKLNEIASTLQHRLLAKTKTLEESIRDFRKSVQHLEFLCEAAGWPLKAWQEIAGLLQSGTKGAAQMWKQSGLKPVLQDHLPLYLGKLQDIVQQMQNELQKPLTTLKEAYYDVTLKPLDEVWQQKTEEYLKKLQAFVPTIVKDVWLMEPIQVSLRILKTGLDMATQQMLSWAEAKLSRAVSKIQKPLSNLYSFSARNCSVAVRLPVLPRGEPTLDLAHVANYLIEEKLLKPLCGLYRINPAAEYYRFKRMMMESPFEHHALLIGNRHLRTFDGKMYSLTSQCSVLLAKDFVQDAFTIILNHDSNGASLHIEMNGTTVIIHLEKKSYKRYNYSLIENCQRFDMPPEANDIAVKRDPDRIVVSGANGVLFSCDLRYDLCTFTMDGWHHGVSAGLFGTNDNEAGNEWILPDHSYADSLPIFLHRWQVSSQCSQVKKTEKQCPSRTSTQICETFFQDSNSVFRNCFQVVDPDPFYHLCTVDMCALHHVKPACTLVAAFVHLCNRNFVPLEMPLQCDGELRLRDPGLPKATR